jgi:hypothetical protein
LTEGDRGFWAWPRASPRELRQFAVVMAVALAGLAGALWYRDATPMAWGLAAAAGVFLLAGGALPGALTFPYGLWMYLARVLGWINTHLLLGLVFYTLFTVIGGVMRVLRHDPLQRRLERGRSSYWRRREETRASRERMQHQF